MRPIFTIHAGEFIVGEHLERKYKRRLNVWVPTRDTGVDLLVTNSKNTKTISFQIKFSRDYLTTHKGSEFQDPMRVCSWFVLDRDKIRHSSAHYWIFVLIGSKKRSRDYLIIKPAKLLKQLERLPANRRVRGKLQVYFWVTEKKLCYDARDLTKSEQLKIAKGSFVNRDREYSTYLNNWKMLENM